MIWWLRWGSSGTLPAAISRWCWNQWNKIHLRSIALTNGLTTSSGTQRQRPAKCSKYSRSTAVGRHKYELMVSFVLVRPSSKICWDIFELPEWEAPATKECYSFKPKQFWNAPGGNAPTQHSAINADRWLRPLPREEAPVLPANFGNLHMALPNRKGMVQVHRKRPYNRIKNSSGYI